MLTFLLFIQQIFREHLQLLDTVPGAGELRMNKNTDMIPATWELYRLMAKRKSYHKNSYLYQEVVTAVNMGRKECWREVLGAMRASITEFGLERSRKPSLKKWPWNQDLNSRQELTGWQGQESKFRGLVVSQSLRGLRDSREGSWPWSKESKAGGHPEQGEARKVDGEQIKVL